MLPYLALVACSGPPPGGSGPGDDDDTSAVPPGGTGETGAPGETGLPGAPGVRGVVIDAAGAPLADFAVLCCNASNCFTDESDDDGSFHFDVDAPVHIAVKTHEDLYTSPRLGAALEPIYVVDELV